MCYLALYLYNLTANIFSNDNNDSQETTESLACIVAPYIPLDDLQGAHAARAAAEAHAEAAGEKAHAETILLLHVFAA